MGYFPKLERGVKLPSTGAERIQLPLLCVNLVGPITAEISAGKPISNDLLSFVTEVLLIPSSDAEENQLLLHFQVSPLLVEGN